MIYTAEEHDWLTSKQAKKKRVSNKMVMNLV